jgi:hypothetical protein
MPLCNIHALFQAKMAEKAHETCAYGLQKLPYRSQYRACNAPQAQCIVNKTQHHVA